MSSISNLAGSFLQSILGGSRVGQNLNNNATATNLTSGISSSSQLQPDTGQLSSFAQIAATLQQLQQSNPAQYKQVTQQIAANLQSAAQTAQASGNATASNQLTQLSTDFSTASSTGQLPNLQDLAQAVGGGHHGHHHRFSLASDSGSSSSSSNSTSASSASTTGNSQALNQLLASLQANSTQSGALNPASIIESTLTSAGVSTIS